MKDFILTLRRHSTELEKLQDQQAKDFLSALKRTEAEILGRLNNVSNASAFQSFQLQQILAETKNGIRTLEKQTAVFYSDAQQQAIDLSIQHTIDELTRLSSSFGDGVPLGFSLDAAAGMSDPAQGLLANQFESSVQAYGIDVLNSVRQRVQIGMLTGENPSSVVESVGEAIDDTSWKAERIVRTETSNAYGASQHRAIDDAAEQIPGIKKVWIHQSSYQCDICIKLHGTERPIDGTWTIQIGKKIKRVAHAPAHPNCTCRVTAMKPSWRHKLAKLGYLDNSDDER